MSLNTNHNNYQNVEIEADGPGYGEPSEQDVNAAEQWATAMTVIEAILNGSSVKDAVDQIVENSEQTVETVELAVRTELANILAELDR